MKSAVLESPAETDQLSELRSALKATEAADKSAKDYKRTADKAWAKAEEGAPIPRGTSTLDLSEWMNRNARYNWPPDKALFDADLAVAQKCQAEYVGLMNALKASRSELEAALVEPLGTLRGKISARRDAIVAHITAMLIPHVDYASDASHIARDLFGVKRLDNALYHLANMQLESKARSVIADWDKYPAFEPK